MIEEIRQHNALVRDQIFKGIVGGEELLEKAHQEGDIHPNGKWVWTKLANGKSDWRVRKDGAAKKPKQMTIDDIPQKDLNRITSFLEKKDPDSNQAWRYLDEEEMDDNELAKFRTVAEYFRYGGKLNARTRENVKKWANLALEEAAERRKRKESQEQVKSKEDAAKLPIGTHVRAGGRHWVKKGTNHWVQLETFGPNAGKEIKGMSSRTDEHIYLQTDFNDFKVTKPK